jgi:hypothetical protein
MPRTSRSVAQRLASQRSSKKRRPSRTGTAAPSQSPAPATASPEPSAVSVDQILDEVAPSAAGDRTAMTPTVTPAANKLPSATRRAGPGVGRGPAKPAPVRRRYAEYADEYEYVWSDLRRILVVSGALMVLLVVASFFIE